MNYNYPNYVLKTNESVLIPEQQPLVHQIVKNGFWSIIVILIICSFFFQKNMFSAFGSEGRIILMILAINVFLNRAKNIETPSEMELQFYDDYLVFYLPKRYYDKRLTRKQINTLKYSEITKCVYYAKSLLIEIYGDGTSVWYNYKKNGELPDVPTETRNFTEGMIYFSTIAAPDVDFVKEIEEHSPLRVTILDS